MNILLGEDIILSWRLSFFCKIQKIIFWRVFQLFLFIQWGSMGFKTTLDPLTFIVWAIKTEEKERGKICAKSVGYGLFKQQSVKEEQFWQTERSHTVLSDVGKLSCWKKMNLWVTRRISDSSHQNPLIPYWMPFPSLHHNDASHQASLLTSPCGFNLKAHKHAANSLKLCQMLQQDCVNFLGRLRLFYSSFIMFECFLLLFCMFVWGLSWPEHKKWIHLVFSTPHYWQKKRSETDAREDRIGPSCLYLPLIT